MSDYKSGLPVRSEADGLDERLQTKIVDATNPDTQQLEIDTDNNAHVEVHGNKPTSGDDVALQLSEEGRPNGRGDYDATDNSKPASAALIAHDRNASKDETHQNLRVSAIDSTVDTEVTALDVAIRDEEGNPYTSNNPLPVALSESEGSEVCDYDQSVAIIKNALANHDYTVTAATTLVIDNILCSSSGRAKFELQIEDGVAADTYTSKGVVFVSTANNNAQIPIEKKITVAAGVNVRIIKTNLDNQPQDLYTTVLGIEK